jgi:integrase
MAPLLDGAGQPVYYGNWRTTYVDHRGRRKTVTLGPDKRLAQKRANLLEARENEIALGLRPPPEEAEAPPASPGYRETVEEYMAWGEAGGGLGGRPWAPNHRRTRRAYLGWWGEVLGLATLADLTGKPARANQALLGLGLCPASRSVRIGALKAFCRWCVQFDRLAADPMARLRGGAAAPTHVRRPLSAGEIERLLRDGRIPPHRRLLYETALQTGFRMAELRGLSADDLDVGRATLHLPAEADKERTERWQPLPPDLARRLREFADRKTAAGLYRQAAARRAGGPAHPPKPLLFVPSTYSKRLDRDLQTAAIEKVSSRGIINFHALRTTYINLLIATNADIKTVQTLARHKDPKLTLNVYGRAREEKLRETVGQLRQILDGCIKSTEHAPDDA